MALQTDSTVLDDESLTAAEAERVLSEPLGPVDPPEPDTQPAVKRGRGRPPGAKNKPKGPTGPVPPPPARSRSTGRRTPAKGPTTEQKIMAAWGVPVAAVAVAGSTLKNPALQADAIVLEHYSAGVGKVFAPVAESSPRFMALLDKLGGEAAPWVAAGMLTLSLGAQLAVNHGLVKAAAVSAFGAVPLEAVLGTTPQAPAPEPVPEPAAPAPDEVAAAWGAGTVPPEWQ